MTDKIRFWDGVFFKSFCNLLLIMLGLLLFVHGIIYIFYGAYHIKKEEQAIDNQLTYIENLTLDLDRYDLMRVIENLSDSFDVGINLDINGEKIVYHNQWLYLDKEFDEDQNVEIKGETDTDTLMIRSRTFENDGDLVTIRITKTLKQIKDARAVAFGFMPITIFMAIVLAFLTAYVYARNITKPILTIEKQLQSMLTLSLDAKIHIKGQDEIGRLAHNINGMYMSLLQTINDYKASNIFITRMENRRLNFLQTTSHELKTPVAKLSILIENMILEVGQYKDRDTYLQEAYQVTQELSGILKDILYTLKGNSLHNRDLTVVDVAESLQDILDYYDLYIHSKGLSLNVQVHESYAIKMDPDELKFFWSNILSNLAKHSQTGSQVDIKLTSGQVIFMNKAEISVSLALANIENSILGQTSNNQTSSFGIGIIERICKDYGIRYRYRIHEEKIRLDLDFSNLQVETVNDL